MFPLEKYVYIVENKRITALQTYAGNIYRGVAKCSPQDQFDFELGHALAAARCNLKIATARSHTLSDKMKETKEQIKALQTKLGKYEEYYLNSIEGYNEAVRNLADVEAACGIGEEPDENN